MRQRLLLLLLVALCLGLLAYRWKKNCDNWPAMDMVEYWMIVHEGCCYEVLETRDEHICLAIQGNHERSHYRIDRKLLTREAQEEIYLQIVQSSIPLLKEGLARRDDPDPRERNYAQQRINLGVLRLRSYTGGHFDDPEDWVRWWEKNHERLGLSRDGKRVVVKGS